MRDRIVIAGATGFVGHAVARALSAGENREIVGLTRGRKDATGAWSELVQCDLFSLKDVEQALQGARYALYLVHSMLPSARLVQGNFADLDLICADNFGRAAAKAGVEQIIYLGGLMPDDEKLSEHLESRREVECALSAHGTPVTTLRAGIVVGAGGSSFEILLRLVQRLPAMLLPAWTKHCCQPIDIGTAAAIIERCIGRTSTYGQTFDIGGPDIHSYADLMRIVGEEVLGKARPALPVPFVSPRLSRGWVALVTGAPKQLVRPLVESLQHDMVCRDRRLQEELGLPGVPFRRSVANALASTRPGSDDKSQPSAYQAAPRVPVTGVRSVQRIPLPAGRDAEWAAQEYMRWLPRGVWPQLRAEIDSARTASFYAPFFVKQPLLTLRFASERSASDRQLFYVTGGLLARPTKRGRLELRVTPDGEHLLTAIHEYAPRLPWIIYRYTQAVVHAWVMKRFGKHLGRMAPLPTATTTGRAPLAPPEEKRESNATAPL